MPNDPMPNVDPLPVSRGGSLATADSGWSRVVWSLYALGLALQLWLWSRSSYAWDQIELTRLGVAYATGEGLSGYGKTMSGGGMIPGSLLQIVLGAPLKVWAHFRSPALVVIFTQAIAGIVFLKFFQRSIGARFAAIYMAVYWLGPWRLYHSGFIWEPNYLLLIGALHLVVIWAQREQPQLGSSILLGVLLVLAPQLHASAAVLFLATAILVVKRWVRLHRLGAVIGLGLGGLTLVPTLLALSAGSLPSVAPAAQPGLGFLKVFPLLKAFGYWLRLGSVDIGRRLRQVVFFPGEEPGPPGIVAEVGLQAFEVLTILTVVVSLIASYQILFRARSPRALAVDVAGSGSFFRRYVIASAVALLVAAGLTSQTVQGWHTIVVLHAASIPPVFWIERGLREGRRRLWLGAVAAVLLLRVPLVVILGLGHPMYIPPDEPLSLDPIELRALEDPRLRGESYWHKNAPQ